MSHTHYVGHRAGQRAGHPVRVRDQAREVLVLVTFSALTATSLAMALLVLTALGRQG